MTRVITVLIVEDEPLIRLDIAGELADMGFNVLEAENAEEAIAILTSDRDVQIIFTDVDMPGALDGLNLAAAVRDRWPPIKIIVTSGLRRVAVDGLPADALFVDKPYQADELAASMRRMMA
jgi:DNA-binding NtrC family response regulator